MSEIYFKVVYNQSTKKLKISQITTYSALVQKIKSLFKKLTGQFMIYYYNDEGQRYDIQSQDDYQIYLIEEFKHKLLIKKQNQPYQPYQNSFNASTILNGSLKDKQQTINQSNNDIEKLLQMKLSTTTKTQSKSEIKAISKLSQISVKKSQTSHVKSTNTIKELIQNTKQSKDKPQIIQKIIEPIVIDNEQKKVQAVKSQIKVINQPLKNQKGSQLIQLKKTQSSGQQMLTVKKQSVEEKKIIVHKISCNGCKSSTIVGNRWRCLQCIDIDFCDKCYNDRKNHVDHEFVMMEAQDYIKKINYRTSIYQLFNPNFKPQKPKARQITAWISQDDIIQQRVQAVNEIWKASEGLSKNILKQFEQWNQKWQISSKQ